MSNLTKHEDKQMEKIEKLLVSGDLSGLSQEERLVHYKKVCESLDLNYLTQPFDYIKLNGKLQLYPKKGATDQLRKRNKISVEIVSQETVGDLFLVTARATTPDGRTDEDTGAVFVKGLRGDNLVNATLKAITKAKRRVTLSICGLGLTDESEVETIPDWQAQRKVEEIDQALSASIPDEVELEPEPEEEQPQEQSLGDYVIPIGKKNKGKRLADLEIEELQGFVDWVIDKIPEEKQGADTKEFIMMANAYLTELEEFAS
jgi:hypothetical protein